jgi:hypothetical protein
MTELSVFRRLTWEAYKSIERDGIFYRAQPGNVVLIKCEAKILAELLKERNSDNPENLLVPEELI